MDRSITCKITEIIEHTVPIDMNNEICITNNENKRKVSLTLYL